MKIPRSVRDLFAQIQPQYAALKDAVDRLMLQQKEMRWHYESRMKTEESYALKLETGRVLDPSKPEDLFACTLVVENHSRIADAERFIRNCFNLSRRRPRDPAQTHLQPYSFDFDDLRLYVTWKDDPTVRPTGYALMVFEVQVKTFLQHAWGIATHDFIYKTDDVDWAGSRIAYQVKAMLENAELSIGEAKRLTDCAMLDRTDYEVRDLKRIIDEIRKRWPADQLPKGLRRLAQNIFELSRTLRIEIPEVWKILDAATTKGTGAKTTNLSPFASIIAELIAARGASLFDPLQRPKCRDYIFIPQEVALPSLDVDAQRRVIQPPT